MAETIKTAVVSDFVATSRDEDGSHVVLLLELDGRHKIGLRVPYGTVGSMIAMLTGTAAECALVHEKTGNFPGKTQPALGGIMIANAIKVVTSTEYVGPILQLTVGNLPLAFPGIPLEELRRFHSALSHALGEYGTDKDVPAGGHTAH